MNFETLLKGTDLVLSKEERLRYLARALDNSANDEELIKNYSQLIAESTRSYCSHDRIKEVFSLALAYGWVRNREEVVGLENKNYLLSRATKYWAKEIRKNKDVEELAEKVYEMLKPKWENYIHNFNLR